MSEIKTIEQLKEIYAEPSARAKNKALPVLDVHAITLINNCHFAVLSTADSQGYIDLSPKGGEPGFVKVMNQHCCSLIARGTIVSIVKKYHPQGRVVIDGKWYSAPYRNRKYHTDANLISACPDGSKDPKVVIKIVIESMYFHCAKAVMRGKLWSDDYKVNRSILPSLAQIFKDQQKLESKALNQEEMLKYYQSSL
ncbi:LOW QUALITY PROTEIN: phosphohydrolase [Vibrio sp. JCM 19053]|nr:LOW QUALITY PROTEIN: phosphohydrolase [Vibrio sp. JCM 19053]